MAKASEFRDLPIEDVQASLQETRGELFNLRFQLATGQLDNYRQVRHLRREVARIRTVLRERELAEEDAS